MKIAIVAGEASGDLIGANVMKSLKTAYPNAQFEGMGGQFMQAEGLKSLYPMEHLSVMGFIEPLKRLPQIISIRNNLKKHFIENGFDLFIGIDAPDFNLCLEHLLKCNGLNTVHYVSPTIWAWRPGRIHKIKKAVDLMLTLFPFETKIYEEHHVASVCVGHPLADEIPMHSDKAQARRNLGLDVQGKIVALLPGSRKQELKYMAPEFIETAKRLKAIDPNIRFITATPNSERTAQFKSIQEQMGVNLVQVYPNQATAVMAASDVVLLTSGTASLQAMLVKRPTLIAYKTSRFVFALAKMLVKVPYIGMPNLLANECLMPEFIQERMRAELMVDQILQYLQNEDIEKKLIPKFEKLHSSLKRDSSALALEAIHNLLRTNDAVGSRC